MALEPRRYDRILNEAPDDVLGAIFGFLLFEASTAAKDDDGLRGPPPPLLPQSPAAAALGLPEHADLAKTRGRADVASRLGHLVMRVVRGPAIQYSVDTPRRVAVPHR